VTITFTHRRAGEPTRVDTCIALVGAGAVMACALLSTGCPAASPPTFEPGDELRDASVDVPPHPERSILSRTLYLVLPDRFANGDPTNDQLGEPDCFDPGAALLFHGGDFAGLAARRPYLRELGIDMLWATPLARQVPRRGNACGYHGYWADLADPADPIDDSVERRFGSSADLDALLAALAADDILFVLDVVANHTGRGSRLATSRPEWFHAAAGCDSEETCPLSGLPDFKHEVPEVAAYVTETTSAWFRRFAVDGLRMDTAKHVPTSYFATSFLPAVRSARPGLFSIAEVWSDGEMAQFRKYFDAGFDSVFHFPLRRALVDAFARGGSVDPIAAVVRDSLSALGLERTLHMSTFLANHDVPRFLTEAGGSVADAELVRRYRLGLAALFTLPGIPQLYYGDELGMLGVFPDNRRDMPAWAFDPESRGGARSGYAGDPAATFALTRQLIALRRDHAALHRGGYVELWRQNGGTANVLAYLRSADDDRAFVILNNGGAAAMRVPFHTNGGIADADRAAWPDGTVLHDRLGLGAPATAMVIGGQIHVDLPARTPAIYMP
jgi:alpha-amylase